MVDQPSAVAGVRVRFQPGPIDPGAWTRAGWLGVGYLTDPAGCIPPALGLAFRTSALGRRIFRAWRDRFGPGGADAALRVAIVEGPAPGFRPGYSVHLGAHPDAAGDPARDSPPDGRPWTPVTAYAVHRAAPPAGTDHLSAFRAEVARHGRYSLVPLLWGGCRFEPVPTLAVRMTRIWFRSASAVAPGDIDHVCFSGASETRGGPPARTRGLRQSDRTI